MWDHHLTSTLLYWQPIQTLTNLLQEWKELFYVIGPVHISFFLLNHTIIHYQRNQTNILRVSEYLHFSIYLVICAR